jgi:hypothetical protein
VESLNDAAAWEEGNEELVAVRKIPLRRRISLLRDLNYLWKLLFKMLPPPGRRQEVEIDQDAAAAWEEDNIVSAVAKMEEKT